MSEPTESTCREWCEQHSRTEQDDLIHEQHRASLWVQRPPFSSEAWSRHLYIGSSWTDRPGREADGWPSGDAPSMTLVENSPGAIPTTIQPDEARALAAALLRGADLVEAAQTTSCPGCGKAAAPEELSFGEGHCCTCEVDAMRVRRANLTVVGR